MPLVAERANAASSLSFAIEVFGSLSAFDSALDDKLAVRVGMSSL